MTAARMSDGPKQLPRRATYMRFHAVRVASTVAPEQHRHAAATTSCLLAGSTKANVRRMRASWFFTLVVGTVACADSPPEATGDVGPWAAAAPMPTARANHCSTGIGDWIVVIGGNHAEAGGFVTTDEIHAAKLENGLLGPWVL